MYFPYAILLKNSDKVKLITDLDLTVWDKSTVAHKKLMPLIELFKISIIYNDYRFMGGVMFLLNACFKLSVLLHNIHAVLLTINMRVQLGGDAGDREYSSNLLKTSETAKYQM